MTNNKNTIKKKENGTALFFSIGIMVFLVVIICFVFLQVGIKIGEGRTENTISAINEQEEKLEYLEKMILDINENVSDIKNNLKHLKKSIETSKQKTAEKNTSVNRTDDEQ